MVFCKRYFVWRTGALVTIKSTRIPLVNRTVVRANFLSYTMVPICFLPGSSSKKCSPNVSEEGINNRNRFLPVGDHFIDFESQFKNCKILALECSRIAATMGSTPYIILFVWSTTMGTEGLVLPWIPSTELPCRHPFLAHGQKRISVWIIPHVRLYSFFFEWYYCRC